VRICPIHRQILTAIVLSLLGLPSFSVEGTGEGEEVAILGSGPVFKDEYEFYSSKLRTSVASRFMREHGVEMSPDFWSTEAGGETPANALKTATLKEISRARAIQELAVEAGLIESTQTYGEIVAELLAENRKRQAMRERREVFYGPVSFRQDAYFEIKFDQLQKALEIDLMKQTGFTGERTRKLLQKKLEEQIAAMLSGEYPPKDPHEPTD
jgi:hypothetical protein